MSAGGRAAARAVVPAALAVVVGVVGVIAAGSGTPVAAEPEGPVAVAVGSTGTAYVGFADGGRLARVAADGSPRRPMRVPGEGPVTGLAVDDRDQVWVDDGQSVSVLDRRGRVVRSFAHRPVLECGAGGGEVRRFGDLALGPGAVYVAERCRATLSAYSRAGQLRATVLLSGGARAGGVAWLRAGNGRPARLLVTIPGRGRLLVYDADRLSDGARPLEVRKVPRVGGGSRPEPTGVVADRFGQVVVADAANQVLLTMDADNHFRHYRTRGYPGRGGSGPGRLRAPAALAQHPQDGTGLAGNLWVADTGNRRIQRWDTGTFTYWTRAVRAPGGSGLPWVSAACTGPTGVRVNAGEAWTRTPQVTVRVVVPADATGLRFGRDAAALGTGAAGDAGRAGDVRNIALREDCSYDWRLAPGDEGVWVEVVGGASDGTVLSDAIGLDTQPPRVRSAHARWVRAEQRWRLSVRVRDRDVAGSGTSGAATVLHSRRRNGSAGTVAVRDGRALLHTRDGRGLGWVLVIDRAGNASDWVRVRRR